MSNVTKQFLVVFAAKRGEPLPGKAYECSKVSPTKYVKLRDFEDDLYKLHPADHVFAVTPFVASECKVGMLVRLAPKEHLGKDALSLATVTAVDGPWISLQWPDGGFGDIDTSEYPDIDFMVTGALQ